MSEYVYVIFDKDMGFVVGAYRTMDEVMKEIFDTMKECGYGSFQFFDDGVDGYSVVFPHADEKCVGHYEINRVEMGS